MTLILFIVSSLIAWFSAEQLYKSWIAKNNPKNAAIGGAIFSGLLIFLFSLMILKNVFDEFWTGIIFIILCSLVLPGIFSPKLLSQQKPKNNMKPVTRNQLIGIFSVATFILMIVGGEKSVESPNTLATTPVETTKTNDTPVMLQSVAPEQAIISTENIDSPAPDDPALVEPTVATGEEIAEDDSATIFDDSDDEDCSGLPTRCSDMRDCAQAEQALACGNSRLDRDDDGIPCESICG